MEWKEKAVGSKDKRVKWGKRNIAIVVAFFLFLFSGENIRAQATDGETDISMDTFLEQSDLEEIQNILDKNLVGMDFKVDQFLKKIWNGEVELSGEAIWAEIKNGIRDELEENKNLWLQCFVIVVVTGVFTNFSLIFKSGQVGETGFYISYLFLFTILLGGFYSVFALVEQAVSVLLLFMKALFPVYFLMVAGTNGAGVATPMYQSSLLIIGGLEGGIGKILLPAIEVFFILSMINQFSKEDKLSKMTEFLEGFIRWGLKGSMGLVLGLQSVETMLLPAIGKVKQNAIVKVGSAIPVFGDTFRSITESVYGVGVLLKNAIGVVGIIGIVLLSIAPILKLVVYTVVYKVGAAILQPISEKRIWNCMEGVAKTSGLLLYLELTCMLLFTITLIICSCLMS